MWLLPGAVGVTIYVNLRQSPSISVNLRQSTSICICSFKVSLLKNSSTQVLSEHVHDKYEHVEIWQIVKDETRNEVFCRVRYLRMAN